MAGYGFGLSQEFHMEVFSYPEHRLVKNISTKSPKFQAKSLSSSQLHIFRVYASNSKGRSHFVTLDGYTSRMPDKHPGEEILKPYF